MNIELKPFESGWFRTREGRLAFATNVGKCKDHPYHLVGATQGVSGIYLESWTEDGIVAVGHDRPNDLVEHLPDCTGWDWRPKTRLQVMAGNIRKEIDLLEGFATTGRSVNSIKALAAIADALEAMEAPPK